MILGIDPGVSGAVGMLTSSGSFINVYDIPTVLANKSSRRLMVSPGALADLLRDLLRDQTSVVAVTENVNSMPGQGVA